MRLVGFIMVVACAASCGGLGNLPGLKKTEPLTTDEGAQQYAEGVCGAFDKCFADNAMQMLFGSQSACVARMKAWTLAVYSQSGASASGDQLAACGDAYASSSCADLTQGPTPAACELPGTLAAGTACASAAQCTTGYCKFGASGGCGTCATRAAAGAACSSSNDCDNDLVCKDNVCAATRIVASGGTCDESDSAQECVYGTYCKRNAGASTGACTAYAAAGANCADAECDAFAGMACNQADVCAVYGVSAAGGACRGTTFNLCADRGDCVNGTSTTAGTCQASVAVGGSCTPSGPDCQYPAACNSNGVCAYIRTCG